jgi:hypothetical protein
LKASGRLGSYFSVSIALIVCRDTNNRSAKSAWGQPGSVVARERLDYSVSPGHLCHNLTFRSPERCLCRQFEISVTSRLDRPNAQLRCILSSAGACADTVFPINWRAAPGTCFWKLFAPARNGPVGRYLELSDACDAMLLLLYGSGFPFGSIAPARVSQPMCGGPSPASTLTGTSAPTLN